MVVLNIFMNNLLKEYHSFAINIFYLVCYLYLFAFYNITKNWEDDDWEENIRSSFICIFMNGLILELEMLYCYIFKKEFWDLQGDQNRVSLIWIWTTQIYSLKQSNEFVKSNCALLVKDWSQLDIKKSYEEVKHSK